MDREAPSLLSVHPPQAIVFPLGEIATANIIPVGPSPIGGLKILTSLPAGTSQSRTVLSWEHVTINWFWASTAILVMIDVCIPISIRRMGSSRTPDACAPSAKIDTMSGRANSTVDQCVVL